MPAQPILVPLDSSGIAEAAIPYAERLAVALDAPIAFLGVVEGSESDPNGVMTETAIEQMQHFRRTTVERYLEATATVTRGRGLEAEIQVRAGQPYEEIIAAANRMDARTIVMATHGRGGLERWALGSVADTVMRLSGRPVLLVRPVSEHHNRHRTVTLNHILVPLDGSELAEQAVGPAVELALALSARLTLLRVEPWMTAITVPMQYIPDVSSWNDAIETAATEYLQEARARTADALDVQTVLLRGAPAAKIEDFIKERAVDLVVMCTHGRGGYRRALVGSVADKIVRGGRPTLLIPSFEHVRAEVSPRRSLAPGGRI
jgi:nucleotide-binding universal stress UspA family protein